MLFTSKSLYEDTVPEKEPITHHYYLENLKIPLLNRSFLNIVLSLDKTHWLFHSMHECGKKLCLKANFQAYREYLCKLDN